MTNTLNIADKDLSSISVPRDFSLVKDRIIFRLVNQELNREMLKGIPFVPYLDLAIIFCFYMDNNDDFLKNEDESVIATIRISDKIMDSWKIKTTDLMECAINNTPRLLEPKVLPLFDMLRDLMGTTEIPFPDDNSPNIFCVTNKKNAYGATCIIYKDLLKELSEKLSYDLFIIPSSVDEVLIIPRSDDKLLPDSINEVIRSVNETSVEEKKLLSDHVYFYNRETDRISY